MVQINIAYQGDLRCVATHGPTGQQIVTDAPADNMGQARSFSPTDLVAAAAGTCMLTIMGIVARKHGLDVTGSSATVIKEMAQQPARRIGRLSVTIHVPREIPQEQRQRIENAVQTCPVTRSLHPDIQCEVSFQWG